MIARAALGLALACAGLPAFAEGGAIRGGEHTDFSRIVMTIEPTTEWSLETTGGRATIRFPGKRLAFDAAGVFTKMPQTRIRAVRSTNEAGGTTVSVELACDCRVSTSFVGARYLALDVADRTAEPEPVPEPENPEARAEREAAAVNTAEELLIRQIERAAGQGLVKLSEAEPPAPAAQPAAQEAPVPRPDPDSDAEADPEAMIAFLNEQEQVEATTVFDRDSRRSLAGRAPAPEACIPDERLDVGAWTNGLPFAEQLPLLRRRLVGELDQPDPLALRDTARLYVRFGFGAEAEMLLRSFDGAASEDGPLLADLARAVDGRPTAADGPLAVQDACPGRHGLWIALGGTGSAFRDPEHFAGVQAAFAELPVDLRELLGPRLVTRLLEAGHPAEARVIYDTSVRAGVPLTPELRLAEARVLAAEGETAVAMQSLLALVERGDLVATEALAELARLALAGDLPLPDRVLTDLRAAAVQYRGSEREAEFRALLAAALARRAELPEAIRETRSAMHDLPAQAERFETLAVTSLADADPAAVGPAAYVETALAAADLVGRTPARDPARRAVAARLVALGLPEPALAVLAPALVLDDPAARLVAAEAQLGLGQTEAARAALAGLGGRLAGELRARSFALDGRHDEAMAALAEAGLEAEAVAYAWPSGDWARVLEAADDPERLAMAGYMTARIGAAPPPEPAPDPAALAPGEAFQEPLPGLDTPSLGAARRLLSTAPGVQGFIAGVLAED